MSAKDFSDHLRLHQVAARYRHAKSTINRWVRAREFPAPVILPGGVRLWSPRDLERFDAWVVRRGQLEAAGKPANSELPPLYEYDYVPGQTYGTATPSIPQQTDETHRV